MSEGPIQAPVRPSADERTMAMLAHLLGLFLGFLGPLIIWLIKKDESAFVNDQAKEALNYQISIMIYMLISIPLMLILVGILAMIVLSVLDVVLTIVGAVSANDGKYYRYPITIRFVK